MLEVRVRYYIKALKERVYLRMCALAVGLGHVQVEIAVGAYV